MSRVTISESATDFEIAVRNINCGQHDSKYILLWIFYFYKLGEMPGERWLFIFLVSRYFQPYKGF